MITSVTSATVTAIASWGVALGAGGAIFVIGLLIALELLGTSDRPRARAIQQMLRVATGPLLLVFVVSIATKALTILAES